jgi:hypothetical protein
VDHEHDPWLARLEHADNCATSVYTGERSCLAQFQQPFGKENQMCVARLI